MDVSEGFEPLAVNPDRFCEGISKIGYQPSAAIMDIVDNSVAAGATRIEIEIVLKEDATQTVTGGIEAFRIVDDGKGMDDAGVNSALQLGSEVVYAKNSLSKFGFGLKSAGFSLGRRIQVFSKRKEGLTRLKALDRDEIRDRGQYGVTTSPLPDFEAMRLDAFKSGTVVEITKPPMRQDSASKIKRELLLPLGVTYFHFLTRKKDPLKITLRIRSAVETVKPVDILFWDEAAKSFDPDTYDPRRPCQIYDDTMENPANPDGPPFRLRMACFPMAAMKGYAGYTPEEKAEIASYLVSRENSGFFFYRNGRLIRWGDRIAGSGRDDIGFRATVDFSTDHDELFHVDVSKQNLSIPEDMLKALAVQTRIPLSQAKQAFEACQKLLKDNQGQEGSEFNRRSETFEESDEAEDVTPPAPEEKKRRRETLDKKAREVPAEPVTKEAAVVADAAAEVFKRVRYSESIGSNNVAVAAFEKDNGTFVRINKNHAFYSLVLGHLQAAEPMRQSIEALLYAAAVAETKTVQNLTDIDAVDIERVLARFRSVFSSNLDAWVLDNQDLFG